MLCSEGTSVHNPNMAIEYNNFFASFCWLKRIVLLRVEAEKKARGSALGGPSLGVLMWNLSV